MNRSQKEAKQDKQGFRSSMAKLWDISAIKKTQQLGWKFPIRSSVRSENLFN